MSGHAGVDAVSMDNASVNRLSSPDAVEALQRLVGATFDRGLWRDACARAGVHATASPTCAELRRIAAELREVPGPAALMGESLMTHIRAAERALRAEAA
jgi:hypothetical protein